MRKCWFLTVYFSYIEDEKNADNFTTYQWQLNDTWIVHASCIIVNPANCMHWTLASWAVMPISWTNTSVATSTTSHFRFLGFKSIKKWSEVSLEFGTCRRINSCRWPFLVFRFMLSWAIYALPSWWIYFIGYWVMELVHNLFLSAF